MISTHKFGIPILLKTVKGQTILFLLVQKSVTVFPHIVSALEQFPPLNSFRRFMYCHQRSQYIRPKSKKNSFCGNYMRKYGTSFQVCNKSHTWSVYLRRLCSHQILYFVHFTRCFLRISVCDQFESGKMFCQLHRRCMYRNSNTT